MGAKFGGWTGVDHGGHALSPCRNLIPAFIPAVTFQVGVYSIGVSVSIPANDVGRSLQIFKPA
jgi:hypothetical protein